MEQHVENIKNAISAYQAQGLSICSTSSFQTQSVPLLHIISQLEVPIPVFFIDTGFHFPETYAFRDELVERFGLKVLNLASKIPKIRQMGADEHFLYASNPDYCCHINKVEPLDTALERYDVWVAGLRRDQTNFRKQLDEVVVQPSGQLKFHPMLEWTGKMVYAYIREHNLPKHPLDLKGYVSIGCQPCTVCPSDELDRNGRWFGSQKTECGIHK